MALLCCTDSQQIIAGSSPPEGTDTRLFSLTDLLKLKNLIGEIQNFSLFQHILVLYFNIMINFKATNTQSSAGCLGQARKDKLQVLILEFGFLSHCHGLERVSEALIIRGVWQLVTRRSLKSELNVFYRQGI